jgi:hypothetical protein
MPIGVSGATKNLAALAPPTFSASTAPDCCVPGTAHVFKGESIIASLVMIDKSQTQPD